MISKTHPYILILLVLIPYFLFSQNEGSKSKFDSIFYETATHISSKDFNRALEIADSLYLNSDLEIHKIRALMLSALLYQRNGTSDKTIEFTLKAEKLAIKSKDYNWQGRILGFMAVEFHNIGIINQRKELIDRMGELAPKIQDELQRSYMYCMYYHETAIYYLENKSDERGWEYLNLAKQHMENLDESDTKYMFLGLIHRAYSRYFLRLKQQPDSALAYYERSTAFLNKSQSFKNYAEDVLFSGMGQAYLMKNQDSLGLDYLKKAEKISEASKNIPIRLEIYKELYEYYKRKGNTSQYVYYLEKHTGLYDELQKKRVKPVELLFENLKKENQKLRYNRMILSVFSVILVLGGGWFYIRYRRKQKKEYERFQRIIEQLSQNNRVSLEQKSTPELTETKLEKQDKHRIPEETEKKIIEGLCQFEQSNKFLTSNFALADLASEIGFNTKYLSYVLKYHYKKDFSSYIQELRINYIIEKLRTNKEYQLYKLSFLAEECGFSSHSKFSSVFKSITGITPTKFIDYLKKE
jgi:AraC-like DNA-binding protein